MKIKSKFIIFVLVLLLLLSGLSTFSFAAGTKYETESNNTRGTANITYDDYDNYGKISSNSDIDYWKFSFGTTGMANIYLGNIPSGCNFNLHLYSSSGTLMAYSANSSNSAELVKCRVVSGITYYAKISSSSGSSNSYYLFRVKRYDLSKARIFTCQSSDINTRNDAAVSLPHLWQSGYDGEEYLNNLAPSAYSVITASGIYVAGNHGDAGIIRFGTITNQSYLYGNAPSSMLNTSRALSNLSNNALSKIGVIIFASCNSGKTHSVYGNLVDKSIAKGAACAVGWTKNINSGDVGTWLDNFFRFCYLGYSVQNAITETDSLIGQQNANSSIRSFYVGASKKYSTVI